MTEGGADARDFDKKNKEFFNSITQAQFEEEYVPYQKEDLEAQVRNLSSRVNFDAVVDWVDKKIAGEGEMPQNTIEELYFLRETEAAILIGALDGYKSYYLRHRQNTLKGKMDLRGLM